MKSILTTLLVWMVSLTMCLAQVQTSNTSGTFMLKAGEPATANLQISTAGVSAHTAFLLMDLRKLENSGQRFSIANTALFEKYDLFEMSGEIYANSFLIASANSELSALTSLGVKINSQSKNIITALIPVNKIEEIAGSEHVDFVQIGQKAKQTMDVARNATWVNLVHQGSQLPQAYFGNNVVVGVIDGGFDYTHPNFYDATGLNNYRVKKVWEQKATTGTPPSGYSYGRELATQTSILNAQTDDQTGSHATHVAGTAAGAGGGVNTNYMGVAPLSDLVFVATDMTDAGVADGIAYIINYANSVGKPCVMNISLGGHVGPHDGLSAFDQYCDGVLGAGKILVGSAGNEGDDAIHVRNTFNPTNNEQYSFVEFPYSNTGVDGEALIDIWGDPNQNYQIAVGVFDSYYYEFDESTPYVQASSNNTTNYTLYDYNGTPCYIEIATSTSPLNNKKNVQVYIDNTSQWDASKWITIGLKATTGKTDMWLAGDGRFTDNDVPFPVVDGSTSSTVGELGGTGNNIITVGAYTTKNSWTAMNGTAKTADFYAALGAIAPFSSKGPTADNRTKPDITAPGNVITASVNRFDNGNYGNSSNDVVDGISNGVNTWYFGQMQGTSMSSPMVAGIIALWLEAYPYLTPTQAKQLLKDNAYTDSYTGVIPASGNNTWGWGKIDAHEGLLDLITKIPAAPSITPTGDVALCDGQSTQLSAPSGYSAYQWSNNASSQSISVSTAGSYAVSVMNNQGYISPWSAPKVVTVHPVPAVPTISITGDILTSSSTTGNQWYFNNNLISGATQQTYSAQQAGSYYVVVTNSGNCSSQSNSVSIFPVGIADLNKVGVTGVYPVPTDDELNILFSENQQNVKFEIIDIAGRLHLQHQVGSTGPSAVETLNLNKLAAGVYTLRVSTKENQVSYKVVVR